MKAIVIERCGDPEVMIVKEVRDPLPAPDQVLVRMKAVGVNPVETYQRAGGQGYSPKLPFTPGADGAGVVESVGEAVAEVRPGDRVYVGGSLTGTYAELCLCSAAQVHPLANNMTFEQGACLWINYATAYRAIFQRGAATAGETVLVHGATGGVGLAAVQWSRLRGLRVVGTYGSERGERVLAEQGVELRFDHKDMAHFGKILEATQGRGVDLVVEMLANVNLAGDLGLLARDGRVVVVGSRGDIQITPRMLMGRDADVRGMVLALAGEDDLKEIHGATAAAAAAGALRPVIQQVLPLAQAPQAHRLVMEAPSHGKIVLTP